MITFCSFYGPVKPHFGHLYKRPNFLHLPQRFIRISPQLGQRNFVASAPGGIGLPQLVQVVKVNVADFSSIRIPQSGLCNCQASLYFMCLETLRSSRCAKHQVSFQDRLNPCKKELFCGFMPSHPCFPRKFIIAVPCLYFTGLFWA
jgi:hypothetical protein